MKREPLMTRAGITAGVSALIALLVAYGVDITTTQTAAIMGVVAVLAPLVAGLTTRPVVTPVADPRDASGGALEPVVVDPDAGLSGPVD